MSNFKQSFEGFKSRDFYRLTNIKSLATAGIEPSIFLWNYEQLMTGKIDRFDSLRAWYQCFYKRIAIVRFQIGTDSVTRIKRTARVSFSDMLSNIGKFKKSASKH